jgi:hypothetical protein
MAGDGHLPCRIGSLFFGNRSERERLDLQLPSGPERQAVDWCVPHLLAYSGLTRASSVMVSRATRRRRANRLPFVLHRRFFALELDELM